jgi:bile acid-coenzyme A ligase
MLIPIADVPRWYAGRKPNDAVAVRHGEDTLTWDELERGANARARAFMAKGVKPGDFVAIGLPNGNAFFETTFAVWKCGVTPTSLSWRLPRGEAAVRLRGLIRLERIPSNFSDLSKLAFKDLNYREIRCPD